MKPYGDNYWYISLNDKRPSNRKIVSIQMKKNYSIMELSTEADPDIIDQCKLIYLGQGFFFDPKIQIEIAKHVRRININANH